MALTPEIRSPSGGVNVVMRKTAPLLRVPFGAPLVIYNIPAEEIRGTFVSVASVFRQISEIQATQAAVMAVCRGRANNPSLDAWGFTLDGHDFFVLKLGTNRKTLVFDISTGQWAWWATGTSASWRASTGMNWNSAGAIPQDFGTNVIVGDDTEGVLWVLDPETDIDERPGGDLGRPFPKVASAQIPTKGRDFGAIYSVHLTASMGKPSLVANSVLLEYSDDQGHNYVAASEPDIVQINDFYQRISWNSLGRMKTPGRIFRLTDHGALARINQLEING